MFSLVNIVTMAGVSTNDAGDEREDLEELKIEKRALTEKLGRLEGEVAALGSKLTNLRSKVEKERESLRGAERATYELKAQENNISLELRELQSKEAELKHNKEEYKNEVEGARPEDIRLSSVRAEGLLFQQHIYGFRNNRQNIVVCV